MAFKMRGFSGFKKTEDEEIKFEKNRDRLT